MRCLCAFTLLAISIVAARAQPDSEREIEEVIVTGTKQGLSVQETTDSVEIFTEQRLADEVVYTASGALSRAANVSVLGDNLATINIRGINRNGTGGAGQGQAINIYVDGAPASQNALFGIQTVWDLEQLEVLRGSQSTVQGRNAIAGAVILKSKNPTFDWEGAARVRAASFGTRQYAGLISGPLLKDELAFRLSADYQESEGYISNAFAQRRVDFRESLQTRAKLRWEPSSLDALFVQLTHEYNRRDNGNSPFVLSPTPGDDPAFADFDPKARVSFPLFTFAGEYDTTRVIGEAGYDFNQEVSLQLLGTYEDVATDTFNRNRLTSSFADLGIASEVSERTYTAEARLEFAFEKWTGLVGAYYFEFESMVDTSDTLLISASFPFLIEPSDSAAIAGTRIETATDNYAFFTSWRFEPNRRWAFDLGLRYDREEFTTQQDTFNVLVLPENCQATFPGELLGLPPGPLTLPCAAGSEILRPPAEPLQSDDFTAILPRAAATYFLNDDLSVFVGARRGYRAGGTALSTSVFGSQFDVIVFEPEFLVSVEAGFRSSWSDGRVTLNGTLFYSEYEDQQIDVPNNDAVDVTVNAGETSLYGFELATDIVLTDQWSVYGNIGLLHTTIDEFRFDDFGGEPVDLAGNELDRSPTASFTLGVVYESSSGLFGSASFNYRSSAESDIFNLGPEELGGNLTERVGSSALLNAQVGYRSTHYTVSVFATNLLDEDEFETINFAGVGLLNGSDGFLDQAIFGTRQPRTFGMSLDLAF